MPQNQTISDHTAGSNWTKIWNWIQRWFTGDLLNPDRMRADFDRMRGMAAWRYNAHLVAALGWCFLVSWPITYAETALIVLSVTYVVRLWDIWRVARWAYAFPVFISLVLLTAYQALSLAWSAVPSDGHKLLENFRFVMVIPMLWPVIEDRGKLIAALCAGFAILPLTQLATAIGLAYDVPSLVFDNHSPDRNGGWWPLPAAGQVLGLALALHVIPALGVGSGRRRLGTMSIAWTLAIATILGIAASGTRAGWIMGAGVILVGVTLATLKAASKATRRRILLTGLGVIVVSGGIAIATLGGSVRARLEHMQTEIREASTGGDTNSADGARYAMIHWSLEAFESRPIFGVGIGGYPSFVRDEGESSFPGAVRWFNDGRHSHGHNAVLHTLATQGVIGVALSVPVVLSIVIGAWRSARRVGFAGYGVGPSLALVGVVLLTPFDAYQVVSRTVCVIFTLVALCPPVAPAPSRDQ